MVNYPPSEPPGQFWQGIAGRGDRTRLFDRPRKMKNPLSCYE